MANNNDSVYPKLAGSGIAGILESLIFHPADTVSKRLMSNQNKLIITGKDANLKQIIFQTQINDTFKGQMRGLYNGLGFSLMHRFTQRMYGYGGQPILKQYIEKTIIPQTRYERIRNEWMSGALIGFGETIFMPFDLLKIKKQTNVGAFNDRSMFEIIKEEKINNYFKGAPITATRNFIAMGNFFMVNSIVREFLFDTQGPWNLSFAQYAFSSMCASFCSISSSSPFDVIKTRVQNKDFGKKSNSLMVIKDIISSEGIGAFYKGLGTKLITIGPKIVFTYSITQYLISNMQQKKYFA